MEDAAKYLIHATVEAEGVVERSDVVGAIFGQTEGLLGEELDLPELRRTGKVGRIDVSVTSSKGVSRGRVTIASGLDTVETATLAAALETIDRVGPCRATLSVSEIEDVRAAKRREVVDRATELVRTGFDDTVMSSAEILSAVRERVRVADITRYEGLPAGPSVDDSDAIIVVEGRADVLRLLSFGIKNVVAVEGTNVPEAVASLTESRTTTAFFDADRGGDLILEELSQIGNVDYVARPPAGRSVEDLDHHEVFTALQNKTPFGSVKETTERTDPVPAGDGEASAEDEAIARPSSDGGTSTEVPVDSAGGETTVAVGDADDSTRQIETDAVDTVDTVTPVSEPDPRPASEPADETDADDVVAVVPRSLYDHVATVIDTDTGLVRFVDEERSILVEEPASAVIETLESMDEVPSAIVLDAICTQELLDHAAELGVSMIVADTIGQLVKRPASVRVHAAADVATEDP